MKYGNFQPPKDVMQLGPEVKAMLGLAGITASYLHSGQWGLWVTTNRARFMYSEAYPNYDDFARYATRLLSGEKL